MKAEELYLPAQGSRIDGSEMWHWYANVPLELAQADFGRTEQDAMRDYYWDAGLLRPWRRAYFREHFSESFTAAARFLLAGKGESRGPILDLGCGTGTQTLYLALKGASVVAVDLDQRALTVLKKRKRHYENLANRSLDITIVESGCFEVDYGMFAPFGGVYSMFAFNMMQPSSRLLEMLLPHLGRHCRFAVLDGNNRSWLARFVPSRKRAVWSPEEFRAALTRAGFTIASHRGAIALMPLSWWLLPRSLARRVDTVLRGNWFFPISHQIMAVRGGCSIRPAATDEPASSTADVVARGNS